jgi:hypothetical protein
MNVYEATILAEIRERRRLEGWYRVNGWASWPDLRRENRAALSALLKVARKARREQKAATERDMLWNAYLVSLGTAQPVTPVTAVEMMHDNHERPERGCDLCSREMDASYRAVVGWAR